MLTGENGCGKSTLLHSIKIALDGAEAPSYVYRLEKDGIDTSSSFLFDAELHNPRTQLEYFSDQPEMQDFLRTASHGQIMLSLFRETFPKMPDGSILLLDEPEMALSVSNQSRILKMLLELVDQKKFRIICATHSPVLTGAKETYVINLDNHTNKNIMPEDQGREGQSTIQ
jgi:predicted ATPase